MSTASYQHQFKVEPDHIDQLNHVNNVVYVQWIQDIAIAHWQKLAPVEIQQAYLWVVARHEIDYKRSALLGDEILVKTRIGAATARQFTRHTDILRGSDQKLLVTALTYWVPVDPQTLKAVKAPPELCDLVTAS